MSASPALFITMPHSHYAEKARWALDWVGLPYTEQPHVPLLHRVATRRYGGGSVPVLVHAGRGLLDSSDIVAYLDTLDGERPLFPREQGLRTQALRLEERFDQMLGPHARRWAYAQLLPQRALLRTMIARGVPPMEAFCLPVLMPVFMRAVRSAFRINPESVERSRQQVRAEFLAVDALLADGRRFLVADHLTVADITFAALASPVLLPAQCGASYPPVEVLPAGMREEAIRLRDGRAGQFAMDLYARWRRVATDS